MHRYVPVVGRIVMGDIAIPILLKPMVDKYPHPTSLLLQFVCCFMLALPVAVALKQHPIDWAACGPAGRGGPRWVFRASEDAACMAGPILHPQGGKVVNG